MSSEAHIKKIPLLTGLPYKETFPATTVFHEKNPRSSILLYEFLLEEVEIKFRIKNVCAKELVYPFAGS